MRYASALVIFLVAVAASADAQLHYRIRARIDPAEHRLQVEADVFNVPSATFHLNRAFTIEALSSEGKEIAYRADDTIPALAYSPGSRGFGLSAKARKTLHLKYSGVLDGTIFNVNTVSPELVELAVYASWYPIFDGGNAFSFQMTVDLPSEFGIATNARQVSERRTSGREITSWSSYGETSDISLVAAPKLKKATGAGVEIFSTRIPKAIADRTASRLAQAMKTATDLYGPARVKGVLRLVYSPRAGSGYSRLPLIVVSEQRALDTLQQEDGEAREFRSDAHELAHFWWMIANPETPDDWINEGFAEYAAFRLAQKYFGNEFGEVRIAEYRRNASHNQTAAAIAETETSSPDREINRYDRTALMLLEAEQRFGQAAIDKLMREMYKRFGISRDATTAKFLDTVASTMGNDAAAFFREKVYEQHPTANP